MLQKKFNFLYYISLCTISLYGLTFIQCDEDGTSRDPDTYEYTNQIIERYGYKCETHNVTTDDGYILTLFRIPCQNCQPVYLQHGFLCDSSNWVLNQNISLAFLLSDAKYDVWIGNYRGTNYSLKHINYDPSEFKFWNWNFDQIAKYDIPACINYIYEIKNETQKEPDLIYIGHSLGTTIFFALMSTLTQYNNRVKAMFALAPVIYGSHTKGLIPFIANSLNTAKDISPLENQGPFIISPESEIMRAFTKLYCEAQIGREFLCKNIFFATTGLDVHLSDRAFDVILGHYPSPTSMQNALHYFQVVKYPYTLQFYDYGITQNRKYYNVFLPPKYDVSKVTVPVSFYWGANDWLSQIEDVSYAWLKVTNKTKFYTIEDKTWTHLDFFFQETAKEMLYDQIIEDLKKWRRN